MILDLKLNKEIFALAVPAIVANITTPLLSMVDTAIVGRLGSAAYVGAVAVGGTLFSMLYWLFSFLRFGTSGVTAQAVGAKDEQEQRLALLRSLAIALIGGFLLICLHGPLGRIALDFIDPDPSSKALAETYFRILIYGAPAVLMQYALTGWFVGMQDTRTPMVVSIVINVVNIVASLVLVFGCGLKIEGVACGSLIAQWVGVGLALAFGIVRAGLQPARHRRHVSDVHERKLISSQEHVAVLARQETCHQPDARCKRASTITRFFSINADIFLRTLCLISVSVWFTRSGARQGDDILAVNSMLLQLFILFSYFMDGFAFAAEAICGKLYGAKQIPELKRAIKRILTISGTMALIFTAIYALGGEAFLRLLTTDTHLIRQAEPYRIWAAAIPLAGFMAFTMDGIVIGLTRTRLMLGSMIAATAAYYLLWLLLTPTLGNHGLWIAFLAYLLLRGGVMLPLLRIR